MKKFVGIFAVIVVAIGLIGYGSILNAVSHKVSEGLDNYRFIIEEGESTDGILSRLEDEGFIKSDTIMGIYLKLNPSVAKNIQAGVYTISPGLKSSELLLSFRNGVVLEKVTFIEGWRREEYASYLAKKKGIEYALIFLDNSYDLEGKLFPDTYYIDNSTDPLRLIAMIKENYEEKMSTFGRGATALSENQVITIASMVQREVPNSTDQAIVAGIILKRLSNGWLLGIDATVQYALANNAFEQAGGVNSVLLDDEFEWWPKIVSEDDLNIISNYNTRKNLGLPPGPIANPGATAIEAVLNPLSTEYWYYLTDREGIMRYAVTLEEHNSNIAVFGISE
jgi:UPF0755 protein